MLCQRTNAHRCASSRVFASDMRTKNAFNRAALIESGVWIGLWGTCIGRLSGKDLPPHHAKSQQNIACGKHFTEILLGKGGAANRYVKDVANWQANRVKSKHGRNFVCEAAGARGDDSRMPNENGAVSGSVCREMRTPSHLCRSRGARRGQYLVREHTEDLGGASLIALSTVPARRVIGRFLAQKRHKRSRFTRNRGPR